MDPQHRAQQTGRHGSGRRSANPITTPRGIDVPSSRWRGGFITVTRFSSASASATSRDPTRVKDWVGRAWLPQAKRPP